MLTANRLATSQLTRHTIRHEGYGRQERQRRPGGGGQLGPTTRREGRVLAASQRNAHYVLAACHKTSDLVHKMLRTFVCNRMTYTIKTSQNSIWRQAKDDEARPNELAMNDLLELENRENMRRTKSVTGDDALLQGLARQLVAA